MIQQSIHRRPLLSLMRAAATLPLLASPALAEPPTSLNVAVIIASGPESAYDGTFLDALGAVAEEAPHDLDITYRVSDPLWGDDAERAMRLFAESGRFDMIWAHSSYSDQVKALMSEFPEVMFVVAGSGNEGLGGNQHWVYKRVHEPAYLIGVLAGAATQSDVIGVIGTYPADDVNDEMNAFIAGAKSVNPDVRGKVAFVESWYDPAKAAELMKAQNAAGADIIFTLANNFAPCEELQILCVGNFRDDSARSARFLSAPLALWGADIRRVVEDWYDHKSDGTPFAGSTDPVWLSMAEGGSAVAPLGDRAALIPPEAVAAFEAAVQAYEAGTLTIPLITDLPVSE